jgi:hypothetical protein
MAHRRSLDFARDDKKERVIARKGRLLNRDIFQIEFGQLVLNLAQDAVLGGDSRGEKSRKEDWKLPGGGQLKNLIWTN